MDERKPVVGLSGFVRGTFEWRGIEELGEVVGVSVFLRKDWNDVTYNESAGLFDRQPRYAMYHVYLNLMPKDGRWCVSFDMHNTSMRQRTILSTVEELLVDDHIAVAILRKLLDANDFGDVVVLADRLEEIDTPDSVRIAYYVRAIAATEWSPHKFVSKQTENFSIQFINHWNNWNY